MASSFSCFHMVWWGKKKAKKDQRVTQRKGKNTHAIKKQGKGITLTSCPAVCLQSGELLSGSISKARAHTCPLLGPLPVTWDPTISLPSVSSLLPGPAQFSSGGLAQLFMQHGQSVDVWATGSASGNANLHAVHDITKGMQRMEQATGLGQGLWANSPLLPHSSTDLRGSQAFSAQTWPSSHHEDRNRVDSI